jgi:hypothetical protein
MAFCVVNYPTLSSDDFNWIQLIRQRHDRLFFKAIAPHFTIVFPTDEINESSMIEHLNQKLSKFEAFDCVFRCAIIGDPNFMGHAHVFLIPDEGFSNLVRLHDRLYTGILEAELRLDLPYIPHIGVASLPNVEECKTIVDELNQQKFEIRGRIDTLDIIGYDGKTTWGIKKYVFAAREL